MTYRITIIDDEDNELVLNDEISRDLVDGIVSIVEEGEIPETYEECETVCSVVSSMLEEAGFDYGDDHDTMLSNLEEMKIVKKDEESEKSK